MINSVVVTAVAVCGLMLALAMLTQPSGTLNALWCGLGLGLWTSSLLIWVSRNQIEEPEENNAQGH